jgi:class 3 adenylate cyclase
MSSVELPVGTVTFLFTDIEGSTQLLKRLGGDRYSEALADHQQILRELFAEGGGHEIDTQGDSFFVAFRRAKDAVATAVAAQRRLAEHEWPDASELRVRMGIHTGEPAAAGERYVGMGVHRAARICAAGHGGQVLVSQTTRELLRDDPIPDVSLRDLGEHQLKDMDEPERLYQVVAPGLEEQFAELKTAAPAPFEGREGELAEAATEEMFSQFCDPAIDAQMARAANTQVRDPAAATVQWQGVEQSLLARAPVVPVYNRSNVDFVSERVGNYQYNPQWGPLLSQVWVK